MQPVIRSVAAIFLALGSVLAVSASWAMATAIPLLAANTSALVMGGTFHSLMGPADKPDFVASYLDNAVSNHLDSAFGDPLDNAVAVFTPEEFFPLGRLTLDESVALGLANLHLCLSADAGCVVNDDPAAAAEVGSVAPTPEDALMVFGFSQSAIIASLAKQNLIDGYEPGDPVIPFMLVANPMRPNGGVLMRGEGWPTIPIMGISFTGASPTDSAQLPDGRYVNPTVDVARQYDGLGGDFPVRPLNLIALVNALLGYALLHSPTVDVPFEQARYQGREGDTTYYLIETDIVPLLQPLALFVPKPILKALDAPLRVLIEDAYEREIGPGTPTPFSWWPTHDLFGLTANLLKSLPVAVDNLFEGFGLHRVLGTQAPGAYGVGGPDLPDAADVAAPPDTASQRVGPESPEPEAVPSSEASDSDTRSGTETLTDTASADPVGPVEPAEPVAPPIDEPAVIDPADDIEDTGDAADELDPEVSTPPDEAEEESAADTADTDSSAATEDAGDDEADAA
ncbi:PE-PPE domain-containing protein [Mycolicibacterium pyrenivorans]|uniref:PE-PPE domain-containing protein n=1 Tax=Mycolicibacterium pyrenivorans TaxID=187102 RepID=UPI0021F25657|nr:PE-PPE domain-containing protein [Mycolicibacterium pyrenivorans]MCV7150062.1 PE-PPE domain-containing protein [Mycolicibacterium pyrenivorans]